MSTPQTVRLTHNGPHQVLNIPPEFELSSNEVVVRKVGESLIIEPVKRLSLLALLATFTEDEDEFPDIDTELIPLNDIKI
jgi:antitoxin VapB